MTRTVTLSPHHVVKVNQFFNLVGVLVNQVARDPRYTPATARGFGDFCRALFENPDTEIGVREGPDDVCRLCDNLVDGVCQKYTAESIQRSDANATLEHNLTEKLYTVGEARRKGNIFFGLKI